MFDVALPTLHHRASNSRIPGVDEGFRVGLWKMEILFGHGLVEAIKEQLPVGPLEGKRMIKWDLFIIVADPFVHSPEMRMGKIEFKFVAETGHQRQLLGRPNWPTDPNRIIRRRLLPGPDVFERFAQVEFLERIVEDHLKSRARKLQEIVRSQTGGVLNQLIIESGVIPPVRGNFGKFAHFL